MAGAKQLLVFSDAGGTGRSYHADRDCPTAHRRRVYYLLEPGWRAAAAIQGLGRTNRTNQASAPIFRPVTTDCRGERRFISTTTRRLDSLGALARGQRQTGGRICSIPWTIWKATMPAMRCGNGTRCSPSWSILDDEGEAIEVWELVRPSGSERIPATRLAESAWELVDEPAFRDAWNIECSEMAERIDIETISIATGLLLPVWNRLPDDDQRVWRISDGQGQSVLGRIISSAGLAKVSVAFSISVEVALSPGELIAGAQGTEGVMLPWLSGARLVRVYVNADVRLEIRGFPPSRLAQLEALGCFTEIIQYKTRLFVPVNRASEILSALEDALADRLVRAG